MNSLTKAIADLKAWHQQHLVNTVVEEFTKAIPKDQLGDEIEKQGGLSPSQLARLVSVFDRYAKLVSKPFGRHFACSNSALICVDSFSHPEGKDGKPILTHIRQDNGKLALTGGGFVDAGENFLEAITREVHEETGFGCRLQNVRLIGIWDTKRGGPTQEHRISVMFTGIVTGTPQPNHEAKEFIFLREQDLSNYPETQFFGNHDKMMKRYFNTPIPPSLDYVSRSEKLEESKKQEIELNIKRRRERAGYNSPLIEKALKKVEDIYERLGRDFTQWSKDHLQENFKGWSQINLKDLEEAAKWNDDTQLWNFLAAFKLTAINLSQLFKTHVTTGECGVIELSVLIQKEHRYIVLKKENQYHLPAWEHRHGERFKETLYRETLEQFNVHLKEDEITLIEIRDNTPKINALGNPLRTFIFKAITAENPNPALPGNEVHLLTQEEIYKLKLIKEEKRCNL